MPDRRAALKARLLAIFRVEAGEHLQSIEELAQRWPGPSEPMPDPDLLERLFRAVHTLKGAARSVGQQEMEQLCQDLETDLAKTRRGEMSAAERLARTLRPAIDRLRRSMLTLPAPGQAEPEPPPQPAPARPPPEEPPPAVPAVLARPAAEAAPARPPEVRRPAPGSATAAPEATTARVDMAGLDRLLYALEELTVLRAGLEQRAAAVSDAIELVSGQHRGAMPTEAARRRLESQLWRLRQAIQQDHRSLVGSLDALADEARALRTSPAWAVLQALPPMLEDIAQAQGKKIAVETAGFDRVLDRRVLEAVKDPLIHLVRNAIDHGVEPPEERQAAGKPAGARVAIRISQHDERRVAIVVEDDGRGIDPARVRDAAARLRLFAPAELEAMEPGQLQELVFRSGLSTTTMVTTISGQGLGLAIVRDRIEAMGGHVELQSVEGAGLRVTLVVPTTIATFRGLRVEAGGQSFLLPMEAVAAVVRRPWGEQWQTGMGRTLSWRDEAVPMAHLARILGIGGRDAAGEAAGAMFSAVIVEAGEERGALVVDAVEGEHSLLLKPLPPPLLRVRNVAAAALMADGDLMLVLRPADLLRSLQLERTQPAEAAEPLRRAAAIRVLIVDDSVTTRLMEQNLFEAAGYDVRLAADGLEALAVLRDERIDLVVSDVDMPGINGFELTRHIRAEARLADVPVVLVTALESREDKEEGLRAGANAYVTKSDFDQTRLLEIVRRMT